jgi:hypothetical protein
VNTIGVCVIGVHTFHLYGWKTLFHFPEGGPPPSLSDMTQGLNPDPPLRRGVQALVSDAQLAAQVLLKRPLLPPSLSQVLPNCGYRLPHVVKGSPARIRRVVASGERGFQRRNLVVRPAAWPDLSLTLSAMISFALPVWRASGFVPLASTIGGFFSHRRAGIVARCLRTVGYGA